jgi:hypothetical protein
LGGPEDRHQPRIAAEVEKVMLAMTSHSFGRNTYRRDLDRFYVAIEHAARTMTDWSDKQCLLRSEVLRGRFLASKAQPHPVIAHWGALRPARTVSHCGSAGGTSFDAVRCDYRSVVNRKRLIRATEPRNCLLVFLQGGVNVLNSRPAASL